MYYRSEDQQKSTSSNWFKWW